MKEAWIVDGTGLRDRLKEHPEWPLERLAEETGRSTSWVKKWRRQIRQAVPDEEEEVLRGLSCIPDHPRSSIAPEVVTQILEIRFHPPPGLNRIPDPLTILYYLHQDEALQAGGVHCPPQPTLCGRS